MNKIFSRNEASIEPKKVINKLIDFDYCLDIFNEDLQELRQMSSDNDWYLRSKIAILLSIVDTYMHNVIKSKIVTLFNSGEDVQNLCKLKISIRSVSNIVDATILPNKDDVISGILNEELIEVFRHITLQSYKDVKEHIKIISTNKQVISDIFEEYCKCQSDFNAPEFKDNSELKKYYNTITTRRNKIVHESDRCKKSLKPIEINNIEVENYINFFQSYITSLHNILAKEE